MGRAMGVSNESWLHSRIERVRVRGREWLEGKRLEPVKRDFGEDIGTPVQQLKNGDYVWTGPPPASYLEKYGLTTNINITYDLGL